MHGFGFCIVLFYYYYYRPVIGACYLTTTLSHKEDVFAVQFELQKRPILCDGGSSYYVWEGHVTALHGDLDMCGNRSYRIVPVCYCMVLTGLRLMDAATSRSVVVEYQTCTTTALIMMLFITYSSLQEAKSSHFILSWSLKNTTTGMDQ